MGKRKEEVREGNKKKITAVRPVTNITVHENIQYQAQGDVSKAFAAYKSTVEEVIAEIKERMESGIEKTLSQKEIEIRKSFRGQVVLCLLAALGLGVLIYNIPSIFHTDGFDQDALYGCLPILLIPLIWFLVKSVLISRKQSEQIKLEKAKILKQKERFSENILDSKRELSQMIQTAIHDGKRSQKSIANSLPEDMEDWQIRKKLRRNLNHIVSEFADRFEIQVQKVQSQYAEIDNYHTIMDAIDLHEIQEKLQKAKHQNKTDQQVLASDKKLTTIQTENPKKAKLTSEERKQIGQEINKAFAPYKKQIHQQAAEAKNQAIESLKKEKRRAENRVISQSRTIKTKTIIQIIAVPLLFIFFQSLIDSMTEMYPEMTAPVSILVLVFFAIAAITGIRRLSKIKESKQSALESIESNYLKQEERIHQKVKEIKDSMFDQLRAENHRLFEQICSDFAVQKYLKLKQSDFHLDQMNLHEMMTHNHIQQDFNQQMNAFMDNTNQQIQESINFNNMMNNLNTQIQDQMNMNLNSMNEMFQNSFTQMNQLTDMSASQVGNMNFGFSGGMDSMFDSTMNNFGTTGMDFHQDSFGGMNEF